MQSFTQLPTGTQMLIGSAARRRRKLEQMILSVFEGWSFEEIIPPFFDYHQVFVKGMGEDQEDKIYRFVDRDGHILALRPEFTSLVAKTVATRLATHPKPIRLYYSGEVLRFEPSQGSRNREFSQIGLELYGGTPEAADIEVLLIVIEVLKSIGVNKFQINIGSVDFFGGIVDGMETKLKIEPERIEEMKDILNRKDQSGLDQLLEKLGLDDRRNKMFRSIPHWTGGKEVLAEARELITNERSIRSLQHLDTLYSTFEELGLSEHLTIDLGEIRGFDYYTGILFRAYVPGLGFEILGGGRYDALTGKFGKDCAAVGFAFRIDRLEQVVPPKFLDIGDDSNLSTEESDLRRVLALRSQGKRVRLCR